MKQFVFSRPIRFIVVPALILLDVMALDTSLASVAHAAGIVVNDAGDTTGTCSTTGTGTCTLRDAITFANSNAGPDTITFNIPSGGACSSANTCTITLGSSLPSITTDVTIDGAPSNGHITLSGNDLYRIMIITGGTTNLNALTFERGSAQGTFNGGAILSSNPSGTTTLNISNSAFSRNHTAIDRSTSGGAIFSRNTILNVTNSTFSGNYSSTSFAALGGAIYNENSTATITNSTFSGNFAAYGGAIATGSGGTTTLKNTIIANSPDGGNCSGSISADDYNIADDATCNNASQFSTAEIALGALADNGGPTWTMALGTGSAAFDTGNDAVCAAAPVNNLDQRGVTRPQGAHCDVGAFEYESEPQPVTLTIVKQAVGGDGTFEIGSTFDSEVVVPLFSLTTQGGTAQQTFSGLAAGFYELGENVPAGWDLTDAKCVGTAQGSVFVLPEELLRFQASPGDNVTCTFTNELAPSLTLVKTVTNDNGGTAAPADFTLTATGPTPISGAGGATSDGTFKAGTYTLSETNLAGYTAGAWSCVKNGGSPVTGSSITLAPGDSATCTINNNDVAPIPSGALTIGYWQNKNGQGIIKSGASTNGVCNSGTWLRQYAPFQDLSATASCSQVATYVTTVIKAATAKGAAMNAMLKAQMLATALDVYFSDPVLGGNKIKAPAPIGGLLIDLTQVCKMSDSSNGLATCSGVYRNASSAFGGATQLTVAQILAYAAGQSNVGGSVWYGQVKATQELAKDTFDAINNNVAKIVPSLTAAETKDGGSADSFSEHIYLPTVGK